MELARCRVDPEHWCNRWCFTLDPRGPGLIPFDLFPVQSRFFWWLAERERNQEGGLVEKSRDLGVTWLCVAWAVHGWLFRVGFSCGFGSRKETYVDEIGDPDSIFEKARILIENLPEWMRPAGYNRTRHAGYCKIVNPENGNTVTGEAGDNIGRGGRKTVYFVDEAAFIERAELIERSLSQTTNCRIDVSTPNGIGNPFYRKRHGGAVPVFTFHWRDDPRKGEAWYADQCRKLDPVTVAQELDIDYTASIEGICIPAAWVRAAVGLELSGGGEVIVGYDVAEEGADVSVVLPRRGPTALPDIRSWGQSNTTEGAWRARDAAAEMGAAEVRYDAGGPGMGVKGTWNTAERRLPFRTVPVNFGGTPSDSVWPDGQTSQEKFLNLRAEMWWTLRRRFEKTYELVTGKARHPDDECVSIPNHPQLIAELSMPLVERTETGKIKMESKEKMRRRGVKSPNFGDALALAFLSPLKRRLNIFA